MKRFAGVLAATVLVLAGRSTAQDRTDQPTAPKSEAERLQELERKLSEQQKEIEELKKAQKPSTEKPAADKAKLDEKGAVAGAQDKPPTFDWGFKDGFFVKGDINGSSFELRPRARLQLDYRAFPHSSVDPLAPHPIPEDQFLIRRARVGFYGNFGVFGFEFEVDPIRNPLPIADFWMNYQQFQEFQIRLGSFKAPFDFEDGMTSDRYLECIERPMATGSGNQLAPDYRIGAQVWGKIESGLLYYSLCVTNQPDSNTVPTGDPLFTGRLQTEFKGFELGVGAIFARVGATGNGANAPGRSFSGQTPGQFVWFTPVAVRGWEQGYVVDAAYFVGPTWITGGYTWGQQERERVGADGTSGTPLVTQGGWVTMGWMFWGPTTPGPHGIPFKDWELFSMDLKKKRAARNVGAELVVRVETMDIRDARGGRRFSNGALTASTAGTAANSVIVRGNQAQALTVGLNIYPIENVRIMFNYVRVRTGDQDRAEHAHSRQDNEFLVRAQIEF